MTLLIIPDMCWLYLGDVVLFISLVFCGTTGALLPSYLIQGVLISVALKHANFGTLDSFVVNDKLSIFINICSQAGSQSPPHCQTLKKSIFTFKIPTNLIDCVNTDQAGSEALTSEPDTHSRYKYRSVSRDSLTGDAFPATSHISTVGPQRSHSHIVFWTSRLKVHGSKQSI